MFKKWGWGYQGGRVSSAEATCVSSCDVYGQSYLSNVSTNINVITICGNAVGRWPGMVQGSGPTHISEWLVICPKNDMYFFNPSCCFASDSDIEFLSSVGFEALVDTERGPRDAFAGLEFVTLEAGGGGAMTRGALPKGTARK